MRSPPPVRNASSPRTSIDLSPAGFDEALAIRIIIEDRLAPTTAIHDAIYHVGILDSQLAGHVGKMSGAASCINING